MIRKKNREFKMHFDQWFNQIELFGLKSERFYTDVDMCLSVLDKSKTYDLMLQWLRAAYAAGQAENNMITDLEKY